MEIETAARRMLLTRPGVTGYVARKVYKFRLVDEIDGTGGLAVVLRRNGGWGRPDPLNTGGFPLLHVDCHADHTRAAEGEIAALDGEDKAYALWRAVDREMHPVSDVWWGGSGSDRGLRVVTSQRWAEPSAFRDEDRHSRGAPLGSVVVVSAQYALTVLHGAAV